MTTDKHGSFETVILPHLDVAYSLAFWLMRERSPAEDVVQEAMLRALRYFPGFQGDKPKAWLLQIVRNVAYGALQQRKGNPLSLDAFTADSDTPLPTLEFADPGDSPETAFIKTREREELQALLAGLPTELCECVVLKDIEELSYKDIARITGVPLGTVMSRLWRARQLLLKATGQVAAPLAIKGDRP